MPPIAIIHLIIILESALRPSGIIVYLGNAGVYVYDYQPVLYYLLAVRAPTQYPLPSHHLNPGSTAPFDFQPAAEMARIVARSPRFVIAGTDPATGRHGDASRLLWDTLSRHYRLVKTYTRGTWGVRVYERLG